MFQRFPLTGIVLDRVSCVRAPHWAGTYGGSGPATCEPWCPPERILPAGPRQDRGFAQPTPSGAGRLRLDLCFMRCSGWFPEYLLACSACVSQSEDQNRSHPALASVHPMSTQVRGPDLGTPEGALRSDPRIATEPGASPTGVVNRPPSWRRRRLFVRVRRRPVSWILRAGRQAPNPGPASDPHRQLLARLARGRRPPRAGRLWGEPASGGRAL